MTRHSAVRRLVALTSLAAAGLAATVADDTTPKADRRRAPKGANINLAESRFALGEFAAADELAARLLEAEPDGFRALHLRGRVALLDNRLAAAEDWLRRAVGQRPTHREPRQDLAEVYYRQDRFGEAGALLAALGDEAKAAKLVALTERRPYASSAAGAVLPFVQTDPLPVVRVAVNGSPPAAFVIDTGAAEIVLDREWAAELGIESLGVTKGTFGGGRQADVGHAVAESVGLGDLVLSRVPVHLLDTTPFSAVAPGEEIRGVLGTVLFYRFLTTLDYPAGELRLEPRPAAGAGTEREPAASGQRGGAADGDVQRVRFWLAGDHYIVANGRANGASPALFFVDTGLAGLAFTCPPSTVEEAGIELLDSAAASGTGGGGRVQVVPFMLKSLSLGGAERQNLPGVFGPFPETLEHSLGFRLAGIVSHGFLRPWAVTFDFDAMELVLRPPAG